MGSMDAFIRAVPKAELHLHIEGTLEPEMVFELARKHHLSLHYSSVEALRQSYCFADLQSFLDVYYQGASVLRDESDFHALTSAYLRRAHADGSCMPRSFSIRRPIPHAVCPSRPSSAASAARSPKGSKRSASH